MPETNGAEAALERGSRPERIITRSQDSKPDSAQQVSCDDRLIAEVECRVLSGLSRSTRYRLELVGKFPKRCHPTPGLARWSLVEVVAWRDAILAARGGAQ